MRNWLIVLLICIILWKMFLAPRQIQSNVPYKLIYQQKVFGKPDKKEIPMIIALHGAGANEKDIINFFKENNLDIPVRVISFRGPLRYSFGYQWAYGKGNTQSEAIANHDAMVRDVAKSIAGSVDELIKRYPTQGRPMIFGFSRGAMLAYYLAVNHPDKFSAVFAASGELPSRFIDKMNRGDLPPIYAYHGLKDEVISISSCRRTITSIRGISDKVYFLEGDYAHNLPKSVFDDMTNRINNHIFKGDVSNE